MSEIVIKGQLFSEETVKAIMREVLVPWLARELARELTNYGEVLSAAEKRNSRTKAPDNRIPKLLDVTEAALWLGIKPVTLRCWISHRKIEFVKVGRCVRLRSETIESLIKANTVPQAT